MNFDLFPPKNPNGKIIFQFKNYFMKAHLVVEWEVFTQNRHYLERAVSTFLALTVVLSNSTRKLKAQISLAQQALIAQKS